MQSSNPTYCIFDVKINKPELLGPYQAKVEETYKAYGGKRMIHGGELAVIEGQAPKGIIVMLQFDSMEQAKAWHDSPEYQQIIQYRHAAAEANIWFIEGTAQ